MLVFETYYNEVINLATFALKKLKDAVESQQISKNNRGISVSFEAAYIKFNVYFDAIPVVDGDSDGAGFAALYDLTSARRHTITNNRGKKLRRKIAQGDANIRFNVANIIMSWREQTWFYKDIKQHIVEHGEGTEHFSFKGVKADKFAQICAELIELPYFQKYFTHEFQHYYNPRMHNWIAKTRKQTPDKPVADALRETGLDAKEVQRYFNYLLSNDEVDSAIAESAAMVIKVNVSKVDSSNMFAESMPQLFVNQAVAILKKTDKWDRYTDSIRKRIIRKLTLIYNKLHEDYREKTLMQLGSA